MRKLIMYFAIILMTLFISTSAMAQAHCAGHQNKGVDPPGEHHEGSNG